MGIRGADRCVPRRCAAQGLPPRVVDASLLGPSLKQVDFVGHVPNPHYSRSALT